MLFRKKQERSCCCCVHAIKVTNDEVQCKKHGTVKPDHSCWRYAYDPCKRVPVKAKAPDFAQYSSDDFSL